MLNPGPFSRKSPLPLNFLGFSGGPILLSEQRTRMGVGSGRVLGSGYKQRFSYVSLNLGIKNWFGSSETGFGHLGRVSSVSGGGSGDSGGFGGSSGGGDGGASGGGGGGGKKWSFLSCDIGDLDVHWRFIPKLRGHFADFL